MINQLIGYSSKLTLAGIVGAACMFSPPVFAEVLRGDLDIKNLTIGIGDSKINVVVYKNTSKPSGLTFLSLHNNEQTFNPIVIASVIEKGGSFVALSPPLDKGGNLCRFVPFSVGGESYYFDPNRIWDDNRIKVGLSANCISNELGSIPSSPAVLSKVNSAVVGFRNDLIRVLGINNQDPNLYLVVVHNNRFLAFDSEKLIPTACAKRYTSKSQASDQASRGDFFFVTDDRTFDFYSSKDYNVVKQLPSTLSTNTCLDGSLSIYAQSKGLPFTTVEVNYSDDGDSDRSALKAQKKSASMLKTVYNAYNSLY
ncbi:hypothetical protein KBY93_12235 [Synechococcus sp. J7-Johnson]|uniref:hypothetical protein n=1 Tax=Synechococcus sp. J7-Johnson TaxID=2823737 RepID=UPI0020CC20FE|nr:hypothetical protein [Synechococcus sp. J7-Johnson]MCP9841395.1 hypothetical protein [Synechococcus sp. J7-Johnson]